MTWENVNLEEGWLRFPSEDAKNHRELVLPLTATLRDLLGSLEERKGNPYVFASRGEKRPYVTDPRATMDEVSRVSGMHLSPHDLRRTSEDIAAHTGV